MILVNALTGSGRVSSRLGTESRWPKRSGSIIKKNKYLRLFLVVPLLIATGSVFKMLVPILKRVQNMVLIQVIVLKNQPFANSMLLLRPINYEPTVI